MPSLLWYSNYLSHRLFGCGNWCFFLSAVMSDSLEMNPVCLVLPCWLHLIRKEANNPGVIIIQSRSHICLSAVFVHAVLWDSDTRSRSSAYRTCHLLVTHVAVLCGIWWFKRVVCMNLQGVLFWLLVLSPWHCMCKSVVNQSVSWFWAGCGPRIIHFWWQEFISSLCLFSTFL